MQLWKKRLGFSICVVGIILLSIIAFSCFHKERDTKISFRNIGSRTFDSAKLFYEHDAQIGTKFTWWESINSAKGAAEIMKIRECVLPEVDYSTKDILVSYGREIIDLACDIDPLKQNPNYNVVVITFSEKYTEDTLFLYEIEKANFVPAFILSRCYILRGNTKEYMGKFLELQN